MKTSQSAGAVGVEADVLPGWRSLGIASLGISVIGKGSAGEVEGLAVERGHDFDGVGVGEVLGAAEDLEGRDLNVGFIKRLEERGEVLGVKQRLVALDVDVDLKCVVIIGRDLG